MNEENINNKQKESELHVVLGVSGGIGNAVTKALHRHGLNIIGINRSGIADVPKEVVVKSVDIYDLKDILSKIEGATHIYNALNVPYTKWVTEFPKLTDAFLEIIRATKAKGIIIDNLYMYGEDVQEPFREDMDYLAQGPKGKIRSTIARLYDQEIEKGDLDLAIVRGPDIYGPGITNGSFYGDRVFGNAIKGKPVDFIGKLDKLHAMIYAKDYGEAVTSIALDDGAYGQIWHVPHAPAITQQQMADLIFTELGSDTKIRTMPNVLLSLLSIFSKQLKEVKEMKYEFEEDYLVDTTKFNNQFDIDVTPHDIAIRETLDWYKSNFTV